VIRGYGKNLFLVLDQRTGQSERRTDLVRSRRSIEVTECGEKLTDRLSRESMRVILGLKSTRSENIRADLVARKLMTML
jgi:hypothetical protein